MVCVLAAELAILAHLNFFGLSFLVFSCKIHGAAALFCAHKSNKITHESPQTKALWDETQSFSPPGGPGRNHGIPVSSKKGNS
jgi:hypothetical protein